MATQKGKFTRREFVKVACAAGVGAVLAPVAAGADTFEGVKVPTRPFGKTGADVSILSLGGELKPSDLIIFRQALKLGVTYWDTADFYGWGKNEKAIGKYFAKYPEDRRKVFLVTKTTSKNPHKFSEKLDTSLKRMNTSHVDLYFVQAVKDARKDLTAEVKAWAEKAKAAGKIRFFGFSTHKNMEANMLAAAKLGWIDGIMMTYNYRLMGTGDMKKAVEACTKAGIGLTAMKTQAALSANLYAKIGSETDDALKMTENFIQKGYTTEQAKLKAVWQNPNIASICSAMPNMTVLQANVAAAVNQKQLSDGDLQRMEQYARKTAPGYCAGCADNCESMVDLPVPISDILRYSMYHHGYRDKHKAFRKFQALPTRVKTDIFAADYSKAERSCPQKIRIAELMKLARESFLS